MRKLISAVIVLTLAAAMPLAWAAEEEKGDDEAKLLKQRCPRPSEFAIVFSFGYAGDHMPKDDAKFDELLGKIKEGGFNTIHCTYTDKRLQLAEKHGVKMMLDYLAGEHHVYKSVDAAKALAEKLRGKSAIWGYNIWNDRFGKMGAGRVRDILNVRRWDPTHPAFIGTYKADGMNYLVNSDTFGYYDYHWKRGPHRHFRHLLAFSAGARQNNSYVYRWVESVPGLPGKGNPNRALYTANTSIACGLKGMLYFLALDLMDRNTLEWTQAGKDIISVNKQIIPLAAEIMKIGNPSAIYSTPITKDMNNNPVGEGKDVMPAGLENNKFPADFWIQPAGGEFVMGVFKDDDGRDAIFVANNNAYAEQDVKLKLAKPAKCSIFDRKEGKFRPLEVKDGAIAFKLSPGGGELIRFEK